MAALSHNAAASVLKQTDKNAIELLVKENSDDLDVLVKIIPRNGWHIYSHSPGDYGLPTQVEWKLNDYDLLSESWSMGKDILYDGFPLNVYQQEGTYLAKLKKAKGKLPSFVISWMACKDECVQEYLEFELAPQAFSLAYDEFTAVSEISEQVADYSLLYILVMAFLGGLILNFMPCVFPILFIKIISLVQEKDKKRDRLEASLYLFGVMVCFIMIAAILAFLRSQGNHIGWGFQLQSPYFVAFMAVLFVILGLMFLDVLKFNLSLRYMPTSSFMTGFLAVLIASPCTAPFMGAAVGWAITSAKSSYFYYPVFLSLGFGYALPFFLAGFFPRAVKKMLPRPGKWMEGLKKIFSIPMFITSIWLVWVLYGNSLGNSSIWQKYDEQKIEELVENGEKVFINFTAKWCISCLVNEKTVFASKDFAKKAKENKIHLFKADWTNNSQEVTKALAKYGRSSIPLYVFYNGNENYSLLPQILTFGIVDKELFDNSSTKN